MPDNYRALTRTYRPLSFDDVVSQRHVSDTLENAIKQGRLAHAYLFCGPRGVGKTTMARVLARRVNDIEEQVDGESLSQTLNVIEIDAASNNKVDDIRDLRDRVRIPPQNGRYKIYIIDEVHMLSNAAFNALLKTLEEPPDHVIFIFATTEPQKVLPTILSRVQRFDFKRISIDEIVQRLADVASQEDIRIDDESLHVIAKKADGALRDALGLLDQAIAFCGSNIEHDELLRALNVVSTDRMFQFTQIVEERNAAAGLQLIDDLLQEGQDIQEFLVGLTEHLRNLYVAQQSEHLHLVQASDSMKKRYRTAADIFSDDDLMRMLHLVSEAQFKVKEAHQPKIQFEITLLKLIHMERKKNLNTLISHLEQLKKNGSSQAEVASGPKPESSSANIGQNNGAEADHPQQTASTQGGEESESSRNSDPSDSNLVSKVKEPVGGVSSQTAESQSEENQESNQSFKSVFGAPSLGGAAVATPEKKKIEKEGKPYPEEKEADITLQLVKDCWDDYVAELKKNMPQMLYFQMQRVEPVKLTNRELLLHCNDDFAKKMVDENKRKLAKILARKVGGFLQFSCSVKKKEKNDTSSMSPYERFKKLQDRDPQIKTLVELFGAELDYNLNQ